MTVRINDLEWAIAITLHVKTAFPLAIGKLNLKKSKLNGAQSAKSKQRINTVQLNNLIKISHWHHSKVGSGPSYSHNPSIPFAGIGSLNITGSLSSQP